VDERSVGVVGALATVVVSQIPMHLDDSVGGGAGDRLEAIAGRRGDFDGVSPVRFRQLRAKRRAQFRIEIGGRQTELAKVAQHEWRGRADNELIVPIRFIQFE
jgi:hypothetical protein